MVSTAGTRASFESTLPGQYFCDPAIYEREQQRIFSDMWVCVGRADAVAEAGQFIVVVVARESVLVVRGRDGELRALLNVCRHRGARLCTELKGHVGGSIRCRYHAWSYGLDGRLLGAPNIAREEHLDRDAFGLMPVHLDVWEGLVWLHLGDEPEPLAEQLARPIIQRFGTHETLDRYGIGDLKVGKRIEYEVEANWKLVVENFMECYHCAPMHPELVRLLPEFRTGASYQGQVGVGTEFAADVDAFTHSGKGSRPRLPGLRSEDDRIYFGFVLWPNVFVNLLPDHVIIHTLQPVAPDRSHVICDWLFDATEAARPEFDPADTVEIFDLVNRQDWEVCELTQQGMDSKAYEAGGIYVSNEFHITAFRDFVLERVGR